MSDTRHVWKPSRANTRTAASRITRRLSTACLRRHYAGTSAGQRYASGRRLASDGSVRRISAWRSRSSSATTNVSRVRRRREHDAPRVDDHRAPAGADARRVLADLVRGDDERLALDRAGAQQDLPVVARRRERERGRDGDDLRALHGEDPVQLGEADVVTDAQPEALPARGLATPRSRRPAPRARTPCRRARRPRRRTCGSCGRSRAARRRDRRGPTCCARARRPRRAR